MTTRWLAMALSGDDFGAFSIARRVTSTIALFSNATGLALTWFLTTHREELERAGALVAAAFWTAIPGGLILALAYLAPGWWSTKVFRTDIYGPLVIAATWLAIATCAFNLVFARYRGTDRVPLASFWHLFTAGVIPLVIVGWGATRWSVAEIVTGLAVGTGLAGIPLGIWLVRAAARVRRTGVVRKSIRAVGRFALPRVPSGVNLGALLAVGPVLAPYAGSLREAGYLVAGQALVRVVEVGTSAIGVVLLPKAASLMARGDRAFLRDRVGDMLTLVVHLGVFLLIQLLLWADVITVVWLGPEFRPAIWIIRVLLLGVVPYLAYALLRSVIDAIDMRPINTRYTTIALLVTVAGSVLVMLLGAGGIGLAAAGTVGLWVLGGLSTRYLVRALAIRRVPIHWRVVVGANALVGGGTLLLRTTVLKHASAGVLVVSALLLGLLASGVYIAVLHRVGAEWTRQVLLRVGAGRGQNA